jgi:hypothetical protein
MYGIDVTILKQSFFDCDLHRVLVYDLRTVARRILIEKIRGCDGLTIPTSESLSLLHGAIITGDMSSLRILLEKKVDVSKTDPWNPVLHRAIWERSSEAVQLLLDAGADISGTDIWGCTPIHYAASRDINITQTLLKAGASVSVQDERGQTPLLAAVRFGEINQVNFLLRNGASCSDVDDDGNSALHLVTHAYGDRGAIARRLQIPFVQTSWPASAAHSNPPTI